MSASTSAFSIEETSTHPRRGLLDNFIRFLRFYPVGAVALFILLILGIISFAAPLVAPHDPLEPNFGALRVSPSWDHLMGTDDLGRDVFSRVLYGGRVTLTVAFIAVAIGDGLAFLIAVVAAYAGGWVDLVSQRVLEVLLAFPTLILALLLLVALGGGVSTIIIAIAIIQIPGTSRVIRSRVLSVKEEPYVEAARVVGATPLRVALRHVAPQNLGLVLVLFSIDLGFAVFTEAALSFLGVGISPPTPSWGNMLGSIVAQTFNPAWWLVVFPGMAIVLTVLSMNLLGDAIRDFADPRAAERRENE